MPKTDEYWVARIRYWPGDEERLTLIKIYYAWKDGRIQFVPALCYEGDPIWADSCHEFELVEKIDMEKYYAKGKFL